MRVGKRAISKTVFALFGFGGLALLIGCASTPKTHFYTLYVAPEEATPAPADAPVLVIEPLSAEPLASDLRLVYRTSPYTVDFYAYHQWAVDPAEQVTHTLAEALRASGAFSQVYVAPAPVAGDLRLRGKLHELCEVDEKDRWYGQVTLDLTLLRSQSGEVIWHKRFSQRIPAASRTPEAVVEALSEGVGEAASQIVREISGANP